MAKQTLSKLWIEGNFLKLTRKPAVNLVLNGEILRVFSLRSEIRQEYLKSIFLLKIVLQSLVSLVRQEKEINDIRKKWDYCNAKMIYLFKYKTQSNLQVIRINSFISLSLRWIYINLSPRTNYWILFYLL